MRSNVAVAMRDAAAGNLVTPFMIGSGTHTRKAERAEPTGSLGDDFERGALEIRAALQ